MEKRKPFLAAALFSFAILSSGFFATAGEAPQRDASLIGMWQPVNSSVDSSSVAFYDGGTFVMDMNGDGKDEIRGNYVVSSDHKIRFVERKGSDKCAASGVYSYVITSGFLRYYPVDDSCPDRIKRNMSVWKKL